MMSRPSHDNVLILLFTYTEKLFVAFINQQDAKLLKSFSSPRSIFVKILSLTRHNKRNVQQQIDKKKLRLTFTLKTSSFADRLKTFSTCP